MILSNTVSQGKDTIIKTERYGSLDGLRAYAAIGIVLMHVLSNIVIKPSENYLTKSLIPFFTDFTLLFMIVSGFSLCCGYYEKIKNGTITPNNFYKKRYARILPYFASLCLLDFVLKPTQQSFYEVYANLTLCFSLIPNMHIEVIGVGWFLGIVFLFYLLFPFFVFMMDSKQKAWLSLMIALGFMLIVTLYFTTTGNIAFIPVRSNMIFCAPLFLSGGIAYQHREQIAILGQKHRIICTFGLSVLTVIYFSLEVKEYYIHYLFELLMFSGWLLYAIGSKNFVLNNRVVKYISGISMEIYLAHMVFFRVIEKMHIERFINNSDLLYILTCILTIGSVICFAHIMKYYVLQRVVIWIEK